MERQQRKSGRMLLKCAPKGASIPLALAFALVFAGDGLGQELFPRRPDMITPNAEKAIENGLAFLVRNQNASGSFGSDVYPAVMTSMAGLALMAGGNTLQDGRYAPQVRRAVSYILGCVSPSGLLGRLADEGSRPMYGHGFAMLFLAQAYGMETTPEMHKQIREALDGAVVLVASSQSARGGWTYTPDSKHDEGSVTITQIQAMRAARNAGILVPKATIDKAVLYIEKSVCDNGGIAYSPVEGGKGHPRPPITAAAVSVLYNAGRYDHPVAIRALKFIRTTLGNKPESVLGSGHDYYYLLYAGQAMYLSSQENWVYFFPKIRDALIAKQRKDGGWAGNLGAGGDMFSTAAALLTLQLPYSYLPVLQR